MSQIFGRLTASRHASVEEHLWHGSERIALAFAREPNPFEPWPLKGILFNSVGPSHGTLAKRPNGDLLMAWTTADKFQIQSRIMLSSSADGTPWAYEHNAIFNTRSPSLLVDDKGTIWMVCLSKRLSTRFRTSAEYDLWLTHSNDGRNWAPLRIIPIPDQPLSAQYQHVAQLVQGSDGRYHIFFNGRITSGETPEALGELRSLNLPQADVESYSSYPTNLDATSTKDGTCHLVFDDFGQAIYYTRSDDLKRWSPVQKLAESEKGSSVELPQLVVDGERVALVYERSSGTWLERGRLQENRLRLRVPIQITTYHAPLNGSRLFRHDDKVLAPAGVDPYYSLMLAASLEEVLSTAGP